MSSIRAEYRDGKIHFPYRPPADWAGGCEVLVYRILDPVTRIRPTDDWSMAPDTVTAWIAAYDAIAGVGPATTDDEKWRSARQAR